MALGTLGDLALFNFKRLYLRFEDGEAILAAFFFEFKGLLEIFKSLVIEFNVMKSVSAGTIIALLAAASSASAFVVPQTTASSIATSLFAERSPELDAAIAEVRECASAFGEETAHFANVWIDKMLEGKQEGMAAGLLDECLIDDDADKCAKYDAALKKLDSLLGVGAGEQF